MDDRTSKPPLWARFRSRWRRSRRFKVGTALTVLAALLLGVGGLLTGIANWQATQHAISTPAPPTTTVLAKKYDKTNPVTTGCTTTSHPASSIDQIALPESAPGSHVATVNVRHSLKCNTTWVQVENIVNGATVTKYVKRDHSSLLSANEARTPDTTKDAQPGSPNSYSFSNQLYAPACVNVRVVITNQAGSVIASLPWTSECK
jgi:hypothetical protein